MKNEILTLEDGPSPSSADSSPSEGSSSLEGRAASNNAQEESVASLGDNVSSVDTARARRRRAQMEKAICDNDGILVRWLASKFNDTETAKDLAQTTYLRALRYAETTDVDNPRALLFKTAANLAANEFRSLSRSRRIMKAPDPQVDDNAIDDIACDTPGPERQMLAKERLSVSLNAIESLPEKVRRAFMLNRFEEKSYREIAEIMGVSQSSVEKYIARALKSLHLAISRSGAPNSEQEKTEVRSRAVSRQTKRETF
ncbi:MAG: RNA polymerase sigma factor [Pseudomonadota bacterium]